jgi:hypothetical protein
MSRMDTGNGEIKMRARMVFGVIVGLLLLAATTRGGEAATVTAGIGLNLRACPSLACRIFTVMPYGGWAEPTGEASGDWYQVSYGGTTSWAHGGWLAFDGGPWAPAPVAEPQWAQGNEPAPAPAVSGGGISSITGRSYGGGVIDAIYYWAGQYGVSADWLMSVAACESGFDPNAVGPNGEIGVFQWMPSTWAAYSGGNIWDPWEQARMTASAFSQGLSYMWVCQ